MSSLTTVVSSSSQPQSWISTLFARFVHAPLPSGRQTLPEGAAELLARADAYAATQPSFAADLRAGAQRLLENR
ncbi:MAG: hypothetical protein WAQ05_14620 [Rubrivivax sp.]